eukprot:448251_1
MFPVFLLLFALNECSFIQYGNKYPSWVYESTVQWIKYYSNNCTFINQYYNVQYPILNLSNISCIQNDNPPSSSSVHSWSSQLFEFYYSHNTYNILLLDRNDTMNMTKLESNASYNVVYNIYITDDNAISTSYEKTPINQLPSDCYISTIKIPELDANYLTICQINRQSNNNNDNIYSMIYIRPWNWHIKSNQYIYTCLPKGKYSISCSTIGTNTYSRISGCSDISTAREVITDQIFACPGTFSGGIYSESAQSLCNTANNYHICESENEAQALGLTRDICYNITINDYEFFAGKKNLSLIANECNNDKNRLYGCTSHEYGCNPCFGQVCDLYTGHIDSQTNFANWTVENENIETISLIDSFGGGVLCCNASNYDRITSEESGCSNIYRTREIISNK